MTEFAEIIDKGECMSTLYDYPNFPWPATFLREVANKREWEKYGFYPSNGLVGEVAFNLESTVYILRINEIFYVPMSKKGINLISETEYSLRKSQNKYQDKDNRQRKINDDWDRFTNR